MKKFLKAAALAGLVILGACTDPEGAKRAAEASGFTNVRITGHSWFGCGEDDTYATGFTAIGQNGKPISGVVCAGFWFKGSTVRITGY